MKIELIKPYMLNTTEKPVGKRMDVTREFGNELIAEGFAIELIEEELKKTKKNK